MSNTKHQVLLQLIAHPEGISGQAIAERLFVVRNGVWKAIESLRRDGYDIRGAAGDGYKIHWGEDDGALSAPSIRRQLKHNEQFHLELHDSIDSTNTRAKALAQSGAPPFTAVISAEQTAGRGRAGRSFHSPVGGVYVSIILPTAVEGIRLHELGGLITAFTAVAASRAIGEVSGLQVGIKWVNDLFIGGRKLCGILTEGGGDMESGSFSYIVVGVGINTHKTELPAELATIATDIESECGTSVSRSLLVGRLLDQFADFESQLVTRSFMDEYRSRSVLLGREITVHRGSDCFAAKAVDIDNNGALIVSVDGVLQTINSGEVSVRL